MLAPWRGCHHAIDDTSVNPTRPILQPAADWHGVFPPKHIRESPFNQRNARKPCHAMLCHALSKMIRGSPEAERPRVLG